MEAPQAIKGAQVRKAYDWISLRGFGWIVYNPSISDKGEFLVGGYKQRRKTLISYGYHPIEATIIAPFMWAKAVTP